MAHRPTPYSIALAALISLHCEENSPLYPSLNEDNVDFTKVDAFLQACILELNDPETSAAKWSRIHATPVGTLLTQFSNCGVIEAVSNQYKEWITVAVQSIDSLTDLTVFLRRCVMEGTVDSSSSNGIFIRAVCEGFDKLSFESTVMLWKDFSREVKEFAENKITESQTWTLSDAQLEHSLREKCVVTAARPCSESISSMQRQLQRILDYNPELPSSHFLRFLFCLETGERVGAIDALHQYVTYALINNDQDHDFRESQQDHSSVHRNEEILQFAAILKAALHDAFGDRTLTVAATEEAVRVAQQSQDAACVAFALGWLGVYARDSNSASQLIHRCIKRATEGQLRSLAAGANLSLAARPALVQQQSSRGSVVTAEEQLSRAAQTWNHWNNASSADPPLSADTETIPWDRPTQMQHLASGEEALVILGKQRLVAAGIWDSFGQTSQSGLSSMIALQEHGEKLPARDVEVAIQNISRVSLLGSTSLVSFQASRNDDLHKTLEMLESKPAVQQLGNECIYGDALRQIVCLREAHNLPLDGVFSIDVALICFEWSIRRGDYLQAEALNQALESHLHPRVRNKCQVAIDILSLKSLLRTRQGRYEEASNLIKKTIDEVQSSEMDSKSDQMARLLLQMAMIQLESSNQLHFTSALPSLLQCLTLTKEQEMDSLHATALSMLAKVYFRMGDHKQAASILEGALPSILQQEHVWFQAESYLLLGKCILKRGEIENPEESSSQKSFEKCLKVAAQKLKRSEELFRRCQDCIRLKEVYYLLARIYNNLPNSTIRRDEASKNFVQISHYLLSAPNSEASGMMSSITNSNDLKKLAARPIPVVTVV